MRTIQVCLAMVAVSILTLACAHNGGGDQADASADLSGEWTGYVIMGNGTRADLVMELERNQEDYAGTLRGADGAIPAMELRNISVTGERVTFDFDFQAGSDRELIRVRLTHTGNTLTGSYTDPTGDSDRIFFQR